MRWMLAAALTFTLAACGGGNNATGNSAGGGSENSAAPANAPSNGAAETAKGESPETVRDAYMNALKNLDVEAMKKCASPKELAKAGDRLEKDFAKMRELVDTMEFETIEWKEENGYWVHHFKQTFHMKDGTSDTDPKRSMYVVKEDGVWRAQRNKPQ